MRKFHIQIIIFILFASLSFMSHAQSTASKLFKQLKKQVYQIRVVDIESGDKNTIGSGFQISKNGHLATNFHVVSSYVHEPKKFRLEYVTPDGNTGDIKLLDIDVIHDLAIIKIKPLQKNYFQFNLKALSKGDRIYSMGNPHDLSMLIIEGNYSGQLQESRYKKILFSGSLNPGMSGGPAFDRKGKLIGVNVAKGGEQLSFLVPVARLKTLLKRVLKKGEVKDFQKLIKADLLSDQQQFYSKILSTKWKSEELGDVTISGKLHESLKCWGHTKDKEDLRYKGVHKHCRSEDRIYINQDMYSGTFSYDYEWITTEKLNRFQFYSQVEKRFKQTSLSNVYEEKNVTNYICDSHFVTISKHSWKVSTCTREYKKYRGLYDVLLLLASVDLNDKALLMKAGMSGVSKDNGMKFIKRFMQEVKWKN